MNVIFIWGKKMKKIIFNITVLMCFTTLFLANAQAQTTSGSDSRSAFAAIEAQGYNYLSSLTIEIIGIGTSGSGVGYGDLNGDGVIDSSDYILLRRFILGIISSINNITAADLNGDGNIDSTDVILLRRYIMEIIRVFPVESMAPTPTPIPTQAPTPTVDPNAKLVALTFDDGPHAQLTPLVLDKLDKHGVPATFFVIGQQINSSTSAVMKRIADSGHEIGNHSWEHQNMNNMSAQAIKESIQKTNRAIFEHTGQTPKFFRPPFLSTNSAMFSSIDLVFAGGVTANDWDQSTTAQQRASAILNGVRDGSIVLLHDVQPLPHPTPEALDIIIPELKRQGYEFVTVSDLFRLKGVLINPSDTKMYNSVP
ncbi:UNVERIFIED_CONTAM: peptidoglycan/xylan/chitin deacetylase (PgdA/CDA1 family) [Acetivibrio alkalicellulosi]